MGKHSKKNCTDEINKPRFALGISHKPNIWLMRIFPRTKSGIRQGLSASTFKTQNTIIFLEYTIVPTFTNLGLFSMPYSLIKGPIFVRLKILKQTKYFKFYIWWNFMNLWKLKNTVLPLFHFYHPGKLKLLISDLRPEF